MALLMLTSGMLGFIRINRKTVGAAVFPRAAWPQADGARAGRYGRRLGGAGGASRHGGYRHSSHAEAASPRRSVVGVEMLQDAALPETEFLLVSCPSTDKTRHIVHCRRLLLAAEGAPSINIGRGPLDRADGAVRRARRLLSGRSGARCLRPGSRAGHDPIWTTRNLVMTPHAAVDDVVNYIPVRWTFSSPIWRRWRRVSRCSRRWISRGDIERVAKSETHAGGH